MINEDIIITPTIEIEAVIDAAGVVSVQLDKTGYTENEASVMAGKAAIAAAISNKGIGANKNNSFSTLANAINSIQSVTKKNIIVNTKNITECSNTTITVTAEVV